MDERICASCAAVLRSGRSEAILDWGKGEKLFFFSDIEGSWDRFVALMDKYDEVFDVTRGKTRGQLRFAEQVGGLRDGWTIVFGGDSQDRGPGDIRFCLTMLMLRKRHPGRVHWVLGNRDGNKMRILYEMSDSSLKKRMKEIEDFEKKGGKLEEWLPGSGFPWWLKDRVLESIKKEKRTPFSYAMNSNDGRSFLLTDLRVGMLKWILAETMGAPDAFEERRKELHLLSREDIGYVSDDKVVDSFVKSVTDDKTDGNYVFDKDWLYEYLSQAHIMLRIGDMVFLHGGITPSSVLQLPEYQMQKIQRNLKDDEFDTWVSELETFYTDGIAAFSRASDGSEVKFDPGFDPYNRYETRHGAGITEYCAPYSAVPTSVVVNSYFDQYGTPERVDGGGWERVWRILRDAGIRYVFCGHRPRGDRGSVTGDNDGTVIVCSVDSSSGGSKFSSVFTRDGESPVRMKSRANALVDWQTRELRGDVDVHELLKESRLLQPSLSPGSFLVDILPNGRYLIYVSKGRDVKIEPGKPNFELVTVDNPNARKSEGGGRGRLSLPSVDTTKPSLGGRRTSFSRRGSSPRGAPVTAMKPQSARPRSRRSSSPTARRRSRRGSKDVTRV